MHPLGGCGLGIYAPIPQPSVLVAAPAPHLSPKQHTNTVKSTIRRVSALSKHCCIPRAPYTNPLHPANRRVLRAPSNKTGLSAEREQGPAPLVRSSKDHPQPPPPRVSLSPPQHVSPRPRWLPPACGACRQPRTPRGVCPAPAPARDE